MFLTITKKKPFALRNRRNSLVFLRCVPANQKPQKLVLAGGLDGLYCNPCIRYGLEGMSESRLFWHIVCKAKCESVNC